MTKEGEGYNFGKLGQKESSPFDKNIWKWVREKPILIEGDGGGARKLGVTFQEYFGKCVFGIVAGESGKQVVMVDPLVVSRQQRAESPTGDWLPVQGLFRRVALLSANLQQFDRGIISSEDLRHIYPGINVAELRSMLASELGQIYFGEFKKREKVSFEGNLESGSSVTTAKDKVEEYLLGTKRLEEKDEKKGQAVKVVSAAGIALVLATACSPATTSIPSKIEATKPVYEPTKTKTIPTSTETVKATEYVMGATGGEYTEVQKALNESETAKVQKDRIQRWLDFWFHSANPPFNPESKDLNWKYLYDNPNNPTEVLLVIEALGEYNGRIFTVPLGKNGFADFPPETSGEEIKTGFGPLELTAGISDQWLSVENGLPVRKDANGNIVARIDLETRTWKEVAFYEKNWGNWAKTLDAADVEKNGVIIPYNPVDNPEEFNKIIEEIKTEKDCEHGKCGFIKSDRVGTNPNTARLEVIGSVSTPYQVMYFKYKNIYYPIIINGGKAVTISDSEVNYYGFVERNVKGGEVSFYVYQDPNKEVIKDLVSWGEMSQNLYDIMLKTGMGIASLGDKQ